MVKRKVGVLAIQGDFAAHAKSLARAGAEVIEVRTPEELAQVDALVIPGGESTTMLKMLRANKLWEPLAEFCRVKPVFGTCAGAILLANEVQSPQQESLQVLDMTVERNAYGRQLDSRVVKLPLEPSADSTLGGGEVEAVFIRAPIIRRAGKDATVLARYNGDPVLVQQGRHLVATFHPELSDDIRIHQYFLNQL